MRRASLALGVVVVALLAPLAAHAQGGDSARIERDTALTGEQVLLTIEVLTPGGASVEVDPANASWGGVEVVRVESSNPTGAGGSTLHVLELVVAGFASGTTSFQPAVFVIQGMETSSRVLPAVEFAVIPTLAPGDPLELSPVTPPVSIDGSESPLLWPAVAVGALAALGAVGLGATLAARRIGRPRPALPPAPEATMFTLADAEALLDRDPVGAYRALSASVREVLGSRYGFPARALTTHEMDRRMQTAGIDRWQARLVTGLLEECDAVVYAGYRPAAERRSADLTMAREIVGAG